MNNPATNNSRPDIVAVDDNPTNLQVLMQMLNQNGYKKCLIVGANDYLPKPVNVDRLFSMLRVWLYQ